VSRNLLLPGIMVVCVSLAAAPRLLAFPEMARATKAACAACHTNVAGGAELTDAGKAFQAEKKAPPADVKGADFIGANKCRICHVDVHKSWQTTPHANSMARLRGDPEAIAKMAAKLKVELTGPADKTEGCVSCHVTGFGIAGGFPAADSTKNANLALVGCESCHGPGSKHMVAPAADKKKTINRMVGANYCQQCHTADVSPSFNFDEYKKKGLHAVKAAAAPKTK
jgi:hypothetical protein